MNIRLGKNQSEDVTRFLDVRIETIECGDDLGDPEWDAVITKEWAERKSLEAYRGTLKIESNIEREYFIYELVNRLDIHEGNASMCEDSAKMAKSIRTLMKRVRRS